MKTLLTFVTATMILQGCGTAPKRFTPSKKVAYDGSNAGEGSSKDAAPDKVDPTKDPIDSAPDWSDEKGEGKDDVVEVPEIEVPEVDTPPESMKPVDPIVTEPMPADCKTFTWDSIKKPEEATCFKSIPEAFATLPDEAKASWTLMRTSRSAQTSTLNNPRIILASPDGSFLLGVSTDPNARQDLELAVFDYENNAWQFAGIDYSTTPPKVEKELCKSCHGLEPHPIWQDYGGWRGAFAANNFLQADEAEVIKKAISGSADSPALLKALKFRAVSSYESGRRLAPNTKYYGGEENSQVLNYVTMQKAAQIAAAKMVRDPLIKATDMLAMSADITCGTRNGTLKKFGYSIEKDLSFALEGTDRGRDMFNGRFSSSRYLGAELVARALDKDPTLASKFPDAVKAFADNRYKYFKTKSLGEHRQFMASGRTSIRSLMSDYLNQTIYSAISNSNHCSTIKDLVDGAQ